MMPAVCSIEQSGIYRSADLVILPRPVERVLVNLYYRFEADALLDLIFHENGKPTLQWFLAHHLKPETSTLIGYRETDRPVDEGNSSFRVENKFYTPLGMVWINESWKIGPHFSKAECGMAFVRGVPLGDTLQLGRMAITWGFDNLGIDTLIGCTPSPNRPATFYGHRLGFQQTTPLEGYSCFNGKLCSVVLQSMTQDRWRSMWVAEEVKEAA